MRGKLEDGQLSNSPLTLQDIDGICEAFAKVLNGVFHERIEYPTTPVPKRDAFFINEHEKEAQEQAAKAQEAATEKPAEEKTGTAAEQTAEAPAQEPEAQEAPQEALREKAAAEEAAPEQAEGKEEHDSAVGD